MANDFGFGLDPQRSRALFSDLVSQPQGVRGAQQAAGALANTGIRAFGLGALPTGFSTLQSILAGRGQTSPLLFNRELSNIGRGTQAAQQTQSKKLARLGLQGSGIGQALQASIGQGGADRRAGRQAQEAVLQDQRMRDDLNLLLNLIINPAQGADAIAAGVQPGPTKGDRALGGITGLLTALGSFG